MSAGLGRPFEVSEAGIEGAEEGKNTRLGMVMGTLIEKSFRV